MSDLLQIRQMSHQQRLLQPAEIAMSRVVHLNDSPRVTTTSDGFPIEHEILFRANNSKGEEVLRAKSKRVSSARELCLRTINIPLVFRNSPEAPNYPQ
jgi:hypothetical protein